MPHEHSTQLGTSFGTTSRPVTKKCNWFVIGFWVPYFCDWFLARALLSGFRLGIKDVVLGGQNAMLNDQNVFSGPSAGQAVSRSGCPAGGFAVVTYSAPRLHLEFSLGWPFLTNQTIPDYCFTHDLQILLEFVVWPTYG